MQVGLRRSLVGTVKCAVIGRVGCKLCRVMIYFGGRNRRIISAISALLTHAVVLMLNGMTMSAHMNAVIPVDKSVR